VDLDVGSEDQVAASSPDSDEPHGVARPALTGDLTRYTQGELRARGFPPRPDPNRQPEAFASWAHLASTQATKVSSSVVSFPDVFHGPAQKTASNDSSTWSGVVADGPTVYEIVSAQWKVPTAVNLCPSPNPSVVPVQDSLFWVGLDGWNTNDLIQDGTESYAFEYTRLGCIFLASYSAWTEYWPLPEGTLSNLTVHAGDMFYAEAWASDSAGNVNPSGGYGWFYMENMTTGAYFNGTGIPRPSNSSPFTGQTAEWIMEKPDDSTGIHPLTDYGTAEMLSPVECDSVNGCNYYNATPNFSVAMRNGSGYESVVNSQGSSGIIYYWEGF
jgi:Peptidase A4 family